MAEFDFNKKMSSFLKKLGYFHIKILVLKNEKQNFRINKKKIRTYEYYYLYKMKLALLKLF